MGGWEISPGVNPNAISQKLPALQEWDSRKHHHALMAFQHETNHPLEYRPFLRSSQPLCRTLPPPLDVTGFNVLCNVLGRRLQRLPANMHVIRKQAGADGHLGISRDEDLMSILGLVYKMIGA